MENSITVGEELRKYFYESGLNFLSSVPQRRIQEMILAMAQKGHSGKMTDCGELGMGHRTTYGHFLSKGKWDHEKVETIQRQKSFQTILSVAGKANQPVFLSIDDTVVPKKKPSRRAARPMEGTGWHYSHLEGKKVYGYQIHAASDYASMLTQDQFHLVTVKGREYYVHRYQGHLNKIDQAVVLLTYPKEAFGVCTALKVFLCSDLSLSDEEVLEHYSHRWKIEVMLSSKSSIWA